MADTHDFDAFFATELAPRLHALEARRKKANLHGACCVGLLLVIGVIALLVGERGLWAYVLLGIAALVFAVLGVSARGSLRDDFKRDIVSAVVRHFSPELRYSPKHCVSRARFTDGRLFTKGIDRYRGEDHVGGRIGATQFEFSEVHAEYKTVHRTKNGTRTQWHTIFKGVYFIADFNKAFSTRTVVLPDTMERVFGFLGQTLQSMNFTRGELIKLEDPEFEKAFAVYGDDQVEARYILTPALMERMLKLRAKTGGSIYFAFVDSQVHVAISTSKNHFEPSLFGSLLNPASIREYYQDLALITGIIEDLNLNTRIWTKE